MCCMAVSFRLARLHKLLHSCAERYSACQSANMQWVTRAHKTVRVYAYLVYVVYTV
jgi:hypothetical protein